MITTTDVRPRPARRARVRSVLAAAVLVVSVALLGWWGWRTFMPAVQVPGGSGVGIGSAPERPAVVIGIDACLDGEGSARIVGVRPVRTTGGTGVTAFATSPTRTNRIGSSDEPVSQLRGYTRTDVSSSCSGGGTQSVAVQLTADSYPATARSFDIDYEVHGITRTATADYSLVLYRGSVPDDDCGELETPRGDDEDCRLSIESQSW